jgi:hypothetical protein
MRPTGRQHAPSTAPKKPYLSAGAAPLNDPGTASVKPQPMPGTRKPITRNRARLDTHVPILILVIILNINRGDWP